MRFSAAPAAVAARMVRAARPPAGESAPLARGGGPAVRHRRPNTHATPICGEAVTIENMGILDYLRIEERKRVDQTGSRWELFRKDSPKLIKHGSLIRLTYRHSLSAPSKAPTVFVGVLLATRRSSGDPTIVVRGIVDGVAVEQVFCIFSPLLERIEVIMPADRHSYKKLYSLRDDPAALLRIQASASTPSRAK